MTLDPAFQGGDYQAQPEKGIQAFSLIWTGWLYSQEWWRRELWRTGEPAGITLQQVMDKYRKEFIPGADANDLIAQMRAWQAHDVGTTPGLWVNPIEINRTGPTYTIETLEALPPGPEYFWILGADQLANFCTWRRWDDIAARVRLVVAQRPGTELAAPEQLEAWLQAHDQTLVRLPFEPLDVSANEIRQRIGRGESTSDLIPSAVAQYIDNNGLYRQHHA